MSSHEAGYRHTTACPPHAMAYGTDICTCTACGQDWTLTSRGWRAITPWGTPAWLPRIRPNTTARMGT